MCGRRTGWTWPPYSPLLPVRRAQVHLLMAAGKVQLGSPAQQTSAAQCSQAPCRMHLPQPQIRPRSLAPALAVAVTVVAAGVVAVW